MQALAAMMRKEFVHIGRDRQLVAFVVVLPALLLVLFGYALRLKIDGMAVGVWDQDQTPFSAEVKTRLQRDGRFRLEEVNSEEEIRHRAQTGEIRMGLIIPRDFSRRLATHQQTSFPLFIDGTMPTLAQASMYGAQLLTDEQSTAALQADSEGPTTPAPKPPIKLEQIILFNPQLRDSDFFLPGIIGIVVMLVVLSLSSGLVREKEQATIEQLLVTPISPLALIAGKMIPYGIIGAADFVVVSVLARAMFGLPFHGALLAVSTLAVIFILSLLALGAFISSVSQTQLQASFVAVFIAVPSVLMSGFVFPIEAMPHWLQPVAWTLPMTYFVEAIRGFVLKGSSMLDQLRDFVMLGVFTLGLTGLSLARFRKQLA
jgi:ABC-2 type transport system permease protein